MPTRSRSTSPSSAYTVAVELHDLADSCAAFPDAVVDEALPAIGAAMKAIALDEARRVTHGDLRLSRFAKGRGIKLGAGYDVVAPATVRLTPRPLGPWTLVESGSARSWWYEPRAGKPGKGAAKRRRRRRLQLRGGGVRWYVRHGGVRGKQAWTRTRDQIVDGLPTIVHESVLAAWTAVR